jgi:hypothetical protein
MRNTEPVCQRSAGGTSTALDPGHSDVSKASSRFYSQHKANLCQSGLTKQNVNLKANNIRKQTELKVKLSLCLTKHYTMKAYGEADV